MSFSQDTSGVPGTAEAYDFFGAATVGGPAGVACFGGVLAG
jgi:hypothetical protein